MEGIPVAYSMNGNNGDNWGGDWWSSFVGGAVGGAIGAAWNRNGNNNCGNGGCCNNNDQFLMDSLTTMRSDVNSIGRDNLMQTANLNAALCSGFGNTVAATQAVGADIARGQSRTEAAIYTTGLQGQIQQKDNTIFQLNAAHANEVQGLRNTYELKSSIDGCCCTTNANIERQGCQNRELTLAEGCATRAVIKEEGDKTRALIAQLDRETLLRDMCAKDAKIAQLEARDYNTTLTTNALMQMRNETQGQTALLLAALRERTGGTTGATGGAAS